MKAWLRKWWVLLLVTAGCVGLLSTWGSKSTSPGRFLFGPPLPDGPVRPQLASSMEGVVLLAPDGSLWAWGGTRSDLRGIAGSVARTKAPVRIGSDTDWRAVTVGGSQVLAVKANGTLWGWGYSHEGELLTTSKTAALPPAQLGSETNWANVHVGHGHVLALKRDGSLWAWGRNTYGAVGDGSVTNVFVPTHISPGAKWKVVVGPSFNSFGIQTDGTIWGWGYDLLSGGKANLLTPTQLDPGTNWTALAAGDFALLAVKSDGTLWICGQNAHLFASGSRALSGPALVQVGTDTDWSEVFCGQSYFIARKKDGSWWGCGENRHGQIGLGSASGRVSMPERLPLRFEPWAFNTSIFGTTTLLDKDGSLWSWGIRAGEPEGRTWLFHLQAWWRTLSGTGGGSVSYTPVYVHDLQPRFVWELPASVKAALGSNALSQPKLVP